MADSNKARKRMRATGERYTQALMHVRRECGACKAKRSCAACVIEPCKECAPEPRQEDIDPKHYGGSSSPG